MDRREQMRRWLALRDERGLTFRELSERTGVPVGTLACWSWKLRQRGGRDRRERLDFVELVAEPAPGDPGGQLEIVLAGNRRVLVSCGFDERTLERVVRALERC